jgi:hypothetical protein
MATETDKQPFDKDEAVRVAGVALEAVGKTLTPLVDGAVVVGIEAVVLIQSQGKLAPSRITLGRTPQGQALVRHYAERVYSGESKGPLATEYGFFPDPPRN